MEVRRKETLKRGTEIIGHRVSVKVAKNKCAPPFRKTEIDNIYGEGFSREGCLLDLGIDLKLLEKTGTWFSFGDTRIGQGRDNAREFLKEHPDVAAQIEAAIRDAAGMLPLVPPESDNSEAQATEEA